MLTIRLEEKKRNGWKMIGTKARKMSKDKERGRNRGGRKRGWFVSRTWLESESRVLSRNPFPWTTGERTRPLSSRLVHVLTKARTLH